MCRSCVLHGILCNNQHVEFRFSDSNCNLNVEFKFKLALDAFLDHCFSPHTNPHDPDKAPGFDSLIKLALLAISHIIGRRQNTRGL